MSHKDGTKIGKLVAKLKKSVRLFQIVVVSDKCKLEILQSLGGLYDFTPSTGLMRLHFRSRSLPWESPPPY